MDTEVRIIKHKMPLVLNEAELLGRLPAELVYKGWKQGQEAPLFECPICGTLCLHVVDPEIKRVAEKAEKQASKISKERKLIRKWKELLNFSIRKEVMALLPERIKTIILFIILP